MAADNCSRTDWLGKRGLHRSPNPSAYIAPGIVDSPITSMDYTIQKPGDVTYKTYSLERLRVAVASGEVQLDWQARVNGKETTVREALSACYECGKVINSLDVACPSCGAPFRAEQSSLGSTTVTASSALDFHVAREGKHFGPYTEIAARNYFAEGRIKADDLCWRPGMDNWMPASHVLGDHGGAPVTRGAAVQAVPPAMPNITADHMAR